MKIDEELDVSNGFPCKTRRCQASTWPSTYAEWLAPEGVEQVGGLRVDGRGDLQIAVELLEAFQALEELLRSVDATCQGLRDDAVREYTGWYG